MKKYIPVTGLLVAVLLCSACANYTEKMREGFDAYQEGDLDHARSVFDKVLDDGDDPHLVRLEKSMVEIASQNADGAAREFGSAIDGMDMLMQQDLGQNLSALILDDTVRDYVGAPFEQIAARMFRGMSYLILPNRFEDFSASCRDLDLRMEQIEAYYERTYQVNEEGGPAEFTFQIPPLGKYFAALAAERRGERDNAGLYMGQIMDAMPNCAYWKQEHERMQGGRRDNLVFVFALVGMAPRKHAVKSKELTAVLKGVKVLYALMRPESNPNAIDRSLLTAPIMIPAYPNRTPFWHHGYAVRSVESGAQTQTERVADFDRYAREEFAMLLPGIMIRAVTRRVIKETAGQALGSTLAKDDKDTAKLLGDLFASIASVAETVDTRSWCTLPREFHVACLEATPDTTSIELFARNAQGNTQGKGLTVPVDLGKPGPAFVFVIQAGRHTPPIVFVDMGHRAAPAP